MELRGNEYFGEIKRSYLENHNDYNIVIDAFGYGWEKEVGMPGMDVREVFTSDEAAAARVLVVQLIQAGLELEDPPFALDPPSHFRGGITFKDGWMLVTQNCAGVAQ